MSKNNEWTILNKSHLSEFKKDTGIIILQNEQITKQLLYIRDELTKIKKELNFRNNVGIEEAVKRFYNWSKKYY